MTRRYPVAFFVVNRDPVASGQRRRRGLIVDSQRATSKGVAAFIERARALGDDDRLALADARAAIDETFHVGAWKAVNEIVAERAPAYVEARVRIGSAYLPKRLEELVQMGSQADRTEVARWQGVARLVRAGLDDALLALIAADLIRPPDLRELLGPWKAMLDAAHERRNGGNAS
jgi:hypothetical protein